MKYQKKELKYNGCFSTLFSSSKKISKEKKYIELAILSEKQFITSIKKILKEEGKDGSPEEILDFVRNFLIPCWERNGQLEMLINEADKESQPPELRCK
jgi:hypothetical protein